MREKLLALCLTLLSLSLPLSAQNKQNSAPLVFTSVTVIDAAGAPAKPGMTVVITDGRITALGKSGKVRVPRGARVVDGAGKFLIPGLWDMNAHPFLYEKDFFPLFALHLYVVNGVTGLRDTFGPLGEEIQWRKGIEVGAILGPRIVIGGPLVDGPKPAFPGSVAVSDGDEGRRAVISLKQRGADFIKVYDLLPRDAYFAIADEAKRQGIPFAGHVPATVTAAEASDAGQKSIEHLANVSVSCSTDAAELQKAWSSALLEQDNALAIRGLARADTKALDSHSPAECLALSAHFVKNGTWHTPTLVVHRSLASVDDPAPANDPRLRYIPRAIREEWDPNTSIFSKALTKDDFAGLKRTFPKLLEVAGLMRRLGVGFLVGTDAPAVPYCFPGFSVHDEMALLVRAGFTPMQALQAATLNPARFLGLSAFLGTVERGKKADLVLLEADPLQDITNTRRIVAVVVNGRLLDRATLDKMLADVETAVGKK